MKVPTSRASGCTVQKYVNSAYDEVKKVADNMAEVIAASQLADEINLIVPELGNIRLCADNMPAIIDAPVQAQNASDSAVDANQSKLDAEAAKVITQADAQITTINAQLTVTKANEASQSATSAASSLSTVLTTATQVESDRVRAEQAAQDALYNANLTFISGGIFNLVPVTKEYPDVSGVVRDTIWIVELPNDGSVPVDGNGVPYYVFTTGVLTGKTIKNGWMLFFDTPENNFKDPIITSFNGILSVNGKSGTHITLAAEDVLAVSVDNYKGSAKLPKGTSAERTSLPDGGEFRFNTDTNRFEGFDGTNWFDLGAEVSTLITLINNVGNTLSNPNLIANADLTDNPINQREFNGNWSSLAVGAYGYDQWMKVSSTHMGYVIEAGKYRPNAKHTLTKDDVVIGEFMSPASGHWTVAVPFATSGKFDLYAGQFKRPWHPVLDGVQRCSEYYQVGNSEVEYLTSVYRNDAPFAARGVVPLNHRVRKIVVPSVKNAQWYSAGSNAWVTAGTSLTLLMSSFDTIRIELGYTGGSVDYQCIIAKFGYIIDASITLAEVGGQITTIG